MGFVSRREDEARNGQRGEKKEKMSGGPGCAGEGAEPLVGSIREKSPGSAGRLAGFERKKNVKGGGYGCLAGVMKKKKKGLQCKKK